MSPLSAHNLSKYPYGAPLKLIVEYKDRVARVETALRVFCYSSRADRGIWKGCVRGGAGISDFTSK